MLEGFIKNEEFLKESHKVIDLLDFSVEIDQFKKRVSTINKPSILGLIGPFGSGKSTMLYQIQKNSQKTDVWINFDAWKYPDRKDLWEGFVLDFAKEISPDDFIVVEKKVDGRQHDDKKTLITTFSRIPGFAVLEGLNHFFETSPARRVNEIQKILKDQIHKVEGNLYIIVEDIDRSGDSGIFFLETLKQFVSGLEMNKKLIVIVPMSDVSYYNNLDSYLKSVDYFEFFQQKEVRLGKFVDEVFDDSLFAGECVQTGSSKLIWTGKSRKTQTISFLEWLFKEDNKMSMRLLKLILRKANLIYIAQVSDGHEPDFRITICVEASKYVSLPGEAKIKYFDAFKKNGFVSSGNVFSSFLVAMFWNTDTISKIERNGRGDQMDVLLRSPGDFKFIDRLGGDVIRHPSHPWEYDDRWVEERKPNFGIASFYLRY